MQDIIGLYSYNTTYEVFRRSDSTCEPRSVQFMVEVDPVVHYTYNGLSVDEVRDESFFLEEVKDFPDVFRDDFG